MKFPSSILFVLALLALLVAAAPAPDDGDGGSRRRYFGARISAPGDRYLSRRRYCMDIKDGVMGFGRPGAEEFEAVGLLHLSLFFLTTGRIPN